MSTLELMLAYRVNGNAEAYAQLLEAFLEPTINYVSSRLKKEDPVKVYSVAFSSLQDAIEGYDIKTLAPVSDYVKDFIEVSMESHFSNEEESEEEEKEESKTEELTEEEIKLFEGIDKWREKYFHLTGVRAVDLELVREVHELTEKQTNRYLYYITQKYQEPSMSGMNIIEMLLSM